MRTFCSPNGPRGLIYCSRLACVRGVPVWSPIRARSAITGAALASVLVLGILTLSTRVAFAAGALIEGFGVANLERGQFGEIAAGPENTIWFTQASGYEGEGLVERMNSGGVLTGSFDTPAGILPTDIAVGPEGNMWFTSPSLVLGRNQHDRPYIAGRKDNRI